MATYSGMGVDLPFTASGNLTAKQYYFMKCAVDARKVLTSTAASAPMPIGILQNDPNTGEEATIRMLGSSKVIANADSGAIAYGDWLISGSDGQAIANTTACTAGQGIAMEALASGCGIEIEILLLPGAHSFGDNVP